MTPFDINAALEGKPVMQRNGMKACVIGIIGGKVIVDLMVLEDVNGDGGEIAETEIRTSVDTSGRYRPQLGESPCDLVMGKSKTATVHKAIPGCCDCGWSLLHDDLRCGQCAQAPAPINY